MLPYSNKSNASKGALRFATKTGKPHTVKHTDAGWIVVPVVEETPAAAAEVNFQAQVDGILASAAAKRAAKRTPQVAPIAGMTPLGVKPAVSQETLAKALRGNGKRPVAPANPDRIGLAMRGLPASPAASAAQGKRAAALASAQAGQIPAAPDFSANTHKPYRAKLAALVALVAKEDIRGLVDFPINPTSSSPKALAKYRDLAVTALTFQHHGADPLGDHHGRNK